jgi:hypothetical protein
MSFDTFEQQVPYNFNTRGIILWFMRNIYKPLIATKLRRSHI